LATRELRTFEEFRQARLGDAGFVVITDTARPAIVHKLNGSCVSADNFNVKVMFGKNFTGKYHLVDSFQARLEFRASACKVCKPLR
jgi:hypothetical protein